MSDLMDYLTWRGDLTFGNDPLCPVDALIFSVLSYVRLEGFVKADPAADPVRLADAASGYLDATKELPPTMHRPFLMRMAKSPRFSQLRFLGAQSTIDATRGIQFGALSALLPGQTLLVAFEGTDDTLVGWEEDFRMSYECPVPAQLRAVEYLRAVAAAYPLRRIVVCGHSKGGNLAMYAAVNAGPAVRSRIKEVYNFDGPGFCDDTLSSAGYLEIRDRLHSFLPESSIVGVLLEHDENYKIVKSSARGLRQHDPYSWEVLGADFVYTSERTAFGKQTEAIMDHFTNTFSPERKRLFGKALFAVLESTEQDTFSGISANKLQSIKNAVRGFTSLDSETRDLLVTTLAALADSRRAVRRAEKR